MIYGRYEMEIEYTLQAIEDIEYWKSVNNEQILKKVRVLIESILESPFEGIGKPELLKYDFAKFWSRRITQEHRLVYMVEGNLVTILSAKGHYY